MPRPRPPFLQRHAQASGKVAWYVRIGRGPRTRIRAAFGTPEFDAEYQAALSSNPRPQKSHPAAGTLGWLIARYRETGAWGELSAATRRQRENIFKHVIAKAGERPFVQITTQVIIAGREKRKDTPAQARHFLDALRGLFKWAVKANIAETDPTASVDNPQKKKGPGFPVWSEDDVAAYERRWPIGTKERVWLDVLLYTGLRRGDAVTLGRQHVRNGIATLRTEKSQREITVTLPILPVLQRTLDADPIGELAFICGDKGKPLTKESFGNLFKRACKKAGLPNRSAHGCRKIAATRAAENGATVAQLEAIFGWTGGKMASLYTQTADRKRLALDAMHALSNDQRTSMPTPEGEVWAPERKSK